MDFHSMFEEMHSAMADMMEVRRAMMDRMFGSFGPSMFPRFPSLMEDFDLDFDRAFPPFPRLTQTQETSQGKPLQHQQLEAASQKENKEEAQGKAASAPSTVTGSRGGSGFESSVMYSSQQYYNSADPTKNFSRHTTTQAGPSGVLESRTAVRDNREQVERVEVRRQVGDRYTTVERKRRLDTGEETVEKRCHNVPCEEEELFEQEWGKLAKEGLPLYSSGAMGSEGTAQPQQLASSAEAQGKIPIGKVSSPAPQAQATPMQLQH